MFFYIYNYRYRIITVLTSLILVSCSLFYLGHLVRTFIDQALLITDNNNINNLVLQIAGTILLFGIASFMRSYTINSISESIMLDVRHNLFEHLLKLKIHIFTELKSTDVHTRLSSDIEAIGKIVTLLFSFVVRNAILFTGSIILMFLQSTKLTCIVVAMLIIIALPISKIGRYIRHLSKSTQSELLKLHSTILESYKNIRLIYAFNQQSSQLQRFYIQQQSYLNSVNHKLRLRSLFFSISIVMILGSMVCIIWIGSNDMIAYKLSSGRLTSFLYYTIIAATSLSGIAESLAELPKHTSAAERALGLLEINELDASSYSKFNDIDRNDTLIKFTNVKFAYPARPTVDVLKGLNLGINPQQFTAIVGKSGSGKSTILQLLLRFFDVTGGYITIGNMNILDVNLKALRNNFIYISQDSYMFSDTIRSNILFSNPQATEQDLLQAIKIAMVDEFLEKMPDGIESCIGENGVMMSGGQRQRIALARGLITNADTIMLDEATSAVDSSTENTILSNIISMKPKKTVIVITHRISAVEKADNIIVLNDGTVTDHGTHTRLLKTCATYQQLALEETKSHN